MSTQVELVLSATRDGEWKTLAEIAAKTGIPEACVSANLRHLRKAEFGGYIVEKEWIGEGWAYRVRSRGEQ